MDPNALPFDVDEMLAGLRPWVECESPTWDAAAVDRCMDLAARDLALLGARVERIPGRMGFGGCVRASFAHASMAPGILVMGTWTPCIPSARWPRCRSGGRGPSATGGAFAT